LPSIEENDILLETAPVKFDHEMPNLAGFEFFDPIQGRFEPPTSEIASLNNYLDTNRKVSFSANQNIIKTSELWLYKEN